MLHVAKGWEFHDRNVKQGAVVYCAFEGAHGYPKRVEALWQHYELASDDRPPLHIMPGQVNLVKDHRILIKEIRGQLDEAVDPAVVVLDTLNRSLVGSEGKDVDMSNYVRAAEAIRTEFDCVVIIVHHCGWDESHPRGFSGLPAAVDAQIAITRQEDIIVAEVEYMRDGPEGQQLTGKKKVIEVGTDASGRLLTSLVIEQHEPIETTAVTGPRKWPRGLKVFHDALIDSLLSAGVDHRIPDGPTVKAVDLEVVRKRFHETYPDPEHDSANPEQRRHRKNMAFHRAVKTAHGRDLIAAHSPECGGQLIWPATPYRE
jgi:hypothetical protein